MGKVINAAHRFRAGSERPDVDADGYAIHRGAAIPCAAFYECLVEHGHLHAGDRYVYTSLTQQRFHPECAMELARRGLLPTEVQS